MASTLSSSYPATEPIAVLKSPPPWRHTLVSLSVRNYRIFAISNLVAMTALWMQRIAQDWLVLELSGSVTAVGVTVALQFAPMLIFGLLGGVIVDRYSKRTLLMITQSVSVLTSATLAVLALTGTVQVWHIYVVAVVLGFVTVVDNPARQVFTNELVGAGYLRNAISVNSSTFQLGGLIGPAISGALLVAVGAGWSFGINAVACAIVVFTLTRLRVRELFPAPPVPRAKGQLREGMRYVVQKPAILWTIVMLAFLAVFSQNLPVILAAYASEVFDAGAGGYGLFNTLVALGALTGALLSTRRRSVRLRTVILGAAVYGALQAFSGLMPTEWLFGTALALAGFSWLFFITAANSLVQMSSNVAIRGRVMALYVLVLLGGQSIGGPVMGWVVEHFGAHIGMVLSGGVPALAALVIAVVLARSGSLRLAVSLRRAEPFVAIVPR
ncbi:MFS transporter [Compostimonas suwonensis]|uniref:Putative MFS family arabinose efflux permease n=1 Tax=Compostimonas suwonensis TaxID=1048394 RepID=A0A2M9BB00_9MICO|nr:MFS transporter [Compostimonas suwonensis]PJJ55124.1 putative MFS family arabinose efflux permease [Compostimonas suwonensis]